MNFTMQEIQKLFMDRDGYQLQFGFDFQKATDETERTIVGFATLDNLDQTNDLVLAKASEDAFRTFRGNIRAQHNVNDAVGRLIAFEPAEYFDANTNQTYKGIRVAVRVSRGAEDTWQKCMDGTYSGFSIGGAVLESENVYSPELKRNVKVITKYRLTELSLVDNPANELANFETVYKMFDAEDLQKGFTEENLFWCPVHKVGSRHSGEKFTCSVCGENMARIGSINENEDIAEKLTKVLSELEIDMEGVITKMADEDKKVEVDETDAVEETTADEATPEVKAEDAADTAADAETEAEETAETEAEDTDVVVPDVAELINNISAQLKLVEETLISKYNDLTTTVEEKLQKIVDLDDKLTEKIAKLQSDAEATTDRVEKIAGATAMRQSEDDVNEDKLEKSADTDKEEDIWGGLFSNKY